jgi:predicted Holliday junction resolvase-like endonuclease
MYIELIWLVIGLVVGAIAVWLYHRRVVRNLKRELERTRAELEQDEQEAAEAHSLEEFNEKQAKKKQERKEKIMELFRKQEEVRNDDVTDLLDVSDVSAYNYLEELEGEDKIEQVGKHGRSVVYKKA